MTTRQFERQVKDLIGDGKARIVEIETKETTRRGLPIGMQPDGNLLFSWIPELASNVKSVDHLSMEVVTVLCKYTPKEVISIKQA